MSEDEGRFRPGLAGLREGPEVFREVQVRYGLLTRAGARRLAEAQDRGEWIEGVRRRLGLVAEVHRCRVWRGLWGWMWFCRRPGCNRVRHDYPSQPEAFAAAFAHARSFLPEPEETPVTELSWEGYVPLLDAVPWRPGL